MRFRSGPATRTRQPAPLHDPRSTLPIRHR
jgi:hypothetical protein